MNLEQFQAHHRIVLPKRMHWHMLSNPIVGQVNAIDSTFGTMVAISDAGLCAIVTHCGVVIGHKDWFIKQVVIREPAPKPVVKSSALRAPFQELVNQFDPYK
jgi:hypothetical protein